MTMETVRTATESVESRVERIFSGELKVEVPSRDTDVIDTGILDSLGFVRLLGTLEREFGTRIDLEELELDDFRSIASIARFLRARDGAL